ncbi:MAG: hypothetical protein VXY42_05260 [Candidatus Thermoplasmatota archaeon]|nr:hypothetical protein [Candidatus Thermoplasmatota archaeon]
MANEKLIAGAVMILLNLVVLAPVATSMVDGAVEDNFETYPYDSACADSDCTTAEADWASSTSDRSYYAWNLTNADEVMAGGDPVYDMLGPFDYEITTTRNIIAFDKEAGTLTYDESKVFTCAMDDPEACNTPITQLNIPYQPQVVGATGMVVNGIMDVTKVAFTTGMLAQDLESMYAGAPTAAAMTQNLAGAALQMTDAGMDEASANAAAPAAVADGFWAGYAANYQATEGESYWMDNGLDDDFAANFSSDSNINMSYAFYDAMGPGGEDLSLTGALGATMLAGHCSSFPTEDSATILADAANGFVNSGTMTRASLWNYTAMADATTPDFEMTIARDWAMCAGVGITFQTLGGGDSDWMLDQTGTAVDASTRLSHMGILADDGSPVNNMLAMGVLFGDPTDEVITGLLEVGEGPEYGVANFLELSQDEATTLYGIDAATHGALLMWVLGWMTDQTSLPMILLGESGDMTASLFVTTSFGAEDPLNGGYLEASINLGVEAMDGMSYWEFIGGDAIELTPEQSEFILYNESLGLTTSKGATLFLYGELTGNNAPMLGGGPWTNQTVAALYGIEPTEADALSALVMTVYETMVPGQLMGFGSAGQYMTMPLNNWLYGWFDPVSMMVADDPTAPSAGWAKLETNETYYGSGDVSTGPATVYVMCTGHNADCEKGEAVSEDGSNELSWRNSNVAANTSNLITVVTLNGTTGGFLTGSGDLVNAGGYAVTSVDCSGTGDVKGIPVNVCSATVDATKTPITAKLINSESLLDSMTPALPVYFGSEINMKSEEISGLIIAGDSTSTFYLDTREGTALATEPAMTDLQPVFQIVQGSEIEDGDAEDMESAIVQNQEFMGWWMNFDNGFDYVALLLYIGGVALIIMHFVMSGQKEDEVFE